MQIPTPPKKKPAADLLERLNLFSGSLCHSPIVLCPLHLGQIQPWHFRSCDNDDYLHVMPWEVYFFLRTGKWPSD